MILCDVMLCVVMLCFLKCDVLFCFALFYVCGEVFVFRRELLVESLEFCRFCFVFFSQSSFKKIIII